MEQARTGNFITGTGGLREYVDTTAEAGEESALISPIDGKLGGGESLQRQACRLTAFKDLDL